MIPGMVGKVAEHQGTVTAAATIGPFKGETVRLTGTTTIATIKAPNNGGFGGLLFFVPGTNVATTTTGNVLNAVTMPVNQVTVAVYVDSLSKWVMGAIS